jgi:hypothetical protein
MVELEAMAHWMYLAPIQPETFLVGISKKQFQTSNKYHNQPAHETEHVATLTKHRRIIYIEYHTPIFFISESTCDFQNNYSSMISLPTRYLSEIKSLQDGRRALLSRYH